MSLHDWSLMVLWKKMAYPPLPKRELGPSIAEGLPRNLTISQSLQDTKKKRLTPTKNIYLWVGEGGIYTMENKDTNTD